MGGNSSGGVVWGRSIGDCINKPGLRNGGKIMRIFNTRWQKIERAIVGR